MTSRLLLNGEAVDPDALAALALLNYGHFTTLQVRAGSVRGLDLHVQRLQQASELLFGQTLTAERVHHGIRSALDGMADASVRVTVFARALDRAQPEIEVPVDVLVSAEAPREPLFTPLTVCTAVHQRVFPAIKHVGTFDLWHRLRQARQHGFDDVLLLTAQGEIAEGSFWNIGFREGDRVIWPQAPALDGITRRIMDAQLRAAGIETCSETITLTDLSRFQSAFALNSRSPARPIARIDEHAFAIDDTFTAKLMACYERASWQAV